ncbi:MAG: mandelate racemase/muconate lactonizing enzyme family protein [Solirubrobacteraceae bacterium]
MRIGVARATLELTSPLHTSYGTVNEREVLTVSLTDAHDLTGYGDIAPLEPYDGVSVTRVLSAFERYRLALEGLDGLDSSRVAQACRQADDLPAALSAIDLALWDLSGRRAGRPVSSLLAEHPREAVAVNATISAPDRASAARQAGEAVERGFRCLKLKVGIGDDAGRVAAVRAAAGPEVALRLDANGAWSAEQAVSAIQALEPAGLELVEEPTHGLEAMREVRERVAARVAIDESAELPGALDAGAADAVCLKVARCGGLTGVLRAAGAVTRTGADFYLASAIDGPLAVAGALHAAAALGSVKSLPPCGLATVGMFAGLEDLLAPDDGHIRVPRGPGLGIEPT